MQLQGPEPGFSLRSHRLDNIDFLRGLVIVLMALDHTKGHFLQHDFDLVDLSKTNPAFFLTRWVSHFCAPTFVFLAGTGAFLFGTRVKTTNQVAWFLLTRGIWLVLLELTVIRFAWFLEVGCTVAVGQVIWAIGWSMVFLAGLVYLPLSVIATIGVSIIAFHNLSDSVKPEAYGDFGWLWKILHAGGALHPWEGMTFHPGYALIPWAGTMAAGYAFGAMMLLDRPQRRREVFGLSVALTVLFLVLRAWNIYGDKIRTDGKSYLPGPWSVQSDWLFTAFSFINCEKYPPSLDYLLMTLGPALCVLALFDRELGPVSRFFVIFGRVPLFFYVLHWYLLKALMICLAYARYERVDFVLNQNLAERNSQKPSDYGYDLWVVYIIWLCVVLALYPLCTWFAGVKQRSRSAWLSYL